VDANACLFNQSWYTSRLNLALEMGGKRTNCFSSHVDLVNAEDFGGGDLKKCHKKLSKMIEVQCASL
jgi:hypothetical protein